MLEKGRGTMKKDIRMIVTDLDRTLLRVDKTISSHTATALRNCQKRGIKVVFATARPKRTITHFFENIPADAVILHNGAVIYSGAVQLWHCGISSELTSEILGFIVRDCPKATLSVEIDDILYANFDVSTIWDYTKATLTDFSDLPDKPAEKIIVCISSAEDIKSFLKYLPPELYIEINDVKLGLIMNRGATKQAAVKLLADSFGIGLHETVAFGDDYNDLNMLKECGIGVAMENALPEVKAAADYICGTNDEDGVAKWIEEYILAE
jgi:5-amino-6-(5-phospho-D-ribitylamino)uracil phosphatase